MNKGRIVSKTDFGNYLATIEERDIDLLLMEEFHVDAEFVAWFCALLDIPDARPEGAWHSVSDAEGETDLLLRIVVDSRRLGVLIENKIRAPEQVQQDHRYHLRGNRSRDDGKFDEYVTVICAPQRYIDGLPTDSLYDHRVSYEEIAGWFSRGQTRREAWRHQIICQAMDHGRRANPMLINEARTSFHFDYWKHLCRKHPLIQMSKPTPKGSKSSWIIMKGLDFPRAVQLHHKLDQQVVELGFGGRRVEEILDFQTELPSETIVMQKGKTATLQLSVPAIDLETSFLSQIDEVEEALVAAYRLMPFSTLLSSMD